jgi:methyltransferase (TIGR00027 family)
VSDSTAQPSAAISRTSIYVAAGRAVGAREPDPTVRNPDSLAEKLLGDPSALALQHPIVEALNLPYDEAMNNVEVVNIVRMMIIRTRFIDDALARAVNGGARQVVVLGAGFDSHAYRCRDLLAGVKVFEVDRPATQALKRQRVDAVLGGPPQNLMYVPIDFQHEDLRHVLIRHGYDPTLATFFILEGVTMYVPEDAVRATFRFVGSHPPGSGIVFDYVYRAMIDFLATANVETMPAAAREYFERFKNLIKDEPWIYGVPVGGEREFMAEFGLELREAFTIGGEESLMRFVTKPDGSLVGAEAIAAAMARMAQAAREARDAGEQWPQMSPEQMREQQRLMAYQLAEAVVT